MSMERQNFSDRLQQSLREAGYAPDSPTQLAREFNIRFAGRPVTAHAARKWLVSESIPTQEKLRILAQWLGVSIHWLRFGSDDLKTTDLYVQNAVAQPRLEPRDLTIIENLRSLDAEHRHIVQTIVRMLVQANGRKGRQLQE